MCAEVTYAEKPNDFARRWKGAVPRVRARSGKSARNVQGILAATLRVDILLTSFPQMRKNLRPLRETAYG